jgi:hypothetical protein
LGRLFCLPWEFVVVRANSRSFPFGSAQGQDDKSYRAVLMLSFAFFRLGGAFFYVGVFAGFEAALHYGLAHAVGEFLGEFVGLVVAIDVDGFAGRVDDDFAVMAGAEMLLYLGHEIGFDLAIKVVG